jgi:hypothetical protein
MNPIERLADAGHTDILYASGWSFDYTSSEWYCYWCGPGKFAENPSEALDIHIQLAGMAALEWLTRGEHILSHGHSTKVNKYLILLRGPGSFTAPTLAEAAIDAAIAVKLNADEQERKQ